MEKKINIEQALQLKRSIPLIDVRSPGEWEQGHIPGAINIPIFTNDERSKVGTVYKRQGKEIAIELGLDIVGPKLSKFVKQAKKIAINKEILVHCWRGGMRSGSMAWLFETAGLKPRVLEGGYKAYRKYIRNSFEREANLLVLGGYTGSGKTDILKEIEKNGCQFIDIEGIANHKGSSFGTIGEEPQVTNEQFENNLADIWLSLDLEKKVWIEDESIQLGRNRIPDALFKKIRSAKVIQLDLPKDVRALRLEKEYSNPDISLLENAILRISKKLGGLRTKEAIEALSEGNLIKAAEISLDYYDKAYGYGLSKRDPQTITIIKLSEDNPKKTADFLKKKFS